MCCLLVKLPRLADEDEVRDPDLDGSITNFALSLRSLPYVSGRTSAAPKGR